MKLTPVKKQFPLRMQRHKGKCLSMILSGPLKVGDREQEWKDTCLGGVLQMERTLQQHASSKFQLNEHTLLAAIKFCLDKWGLEEYMVVFFFFETMKSLDKVVINLSEFLLWPKLSCNRGFISIPKAILGWEETFPALELDFPAMGIMFLTPSCCLWGAAVFKALCNAISCDIWQHWWWPLWRHWRCVR